jgi:hypothetical protein
MSVRTAMKMRANTARPTEVNDGGGGVTRSFATRLTGVPCWWSPISSSENTVAAQTGVSPTSRVFMPKGTDITEADQVTEIRDRLGVLLIQGPLRVETVIPRRNHLDVYCTARQPYWKP